MNGTKQYQAITISKQPKTVLYIPANLTETEKAKRISRYLTKDGKLKIETVRELF